MVDAKGGAGRVSARAFISNLLRKYGIFFIFLGMIIIASILSPAFLTKINLINIVRQISIIGLIALGVTGVIVAAGIDLSSGSVVGVVAVVAACFAQYPGQRTGHTPRVCRQPAVRLASCGVFCRGSHGPHQRLSHCKDEDPAVHCDLGDVFCCTRRSHALHRGPTISNLTDTYNFIGQGDIFGIPLPIWILIVMALVTHALYSRTKFGKYIYAIGGNEQAAHVSGINVTNYKMLIYVYAGFLSGVAGIVVSSRIGSGAAGLGVGYEFDAITAAVIGGASLSAGGIGSIPGTVIGALIIGVLNNILDLTNVSAYWQQIVKGAIIVGAVILDQQKNKGDK